MTRRKHVSLPTQRRIRCGKDGKHEESDPVLCHGGSESTAQRTEKGRDTAIVTLCCKSFVRRAPSSCVYVYLLLRMLLRTGVGLQERAWVGRLWTVRSGKTQCSKLLQLTTLIVCFVHFLAAKKKNE
jgi:hypothetical protein